MTEKEIADAFVEIAAEMDKASADPLAYRLCAVCLTAVDRETHNSHMQLAHGYTTLEIGHGAT